MVKVRVKKGSLSPRSVRTVCVLLGVLEVPLMFRYSSKVVKLLPLNMRLMGLKSVLVLVVSWGSRRACIFLVDLVVTCSQSLLDVWLFESLAEDLTILAREFLSPQPGAAGRRGGCGC